MEREELKKIWAEKARKLLEGRKIMHVRYLNQKEEELLDWTSSGIALVLDNRIIIYPSMDDEGNGAGALFTTDDSLPTIPAI